MRPLISPVRWSPFFMTTTSVFVRATRETGRRSIRLRVTARIFISSRFLRIIVVTRRLHDTGKISDSTVSPLLAIGQPASHEAIRKAKTGLRSSNKQCIPLFGFPQPGVLPSNGDVLVVAAVPYVGSIAVAEFQRLVFADRNRDGAAEAGIRLPRERVLDAAHSCFSAEPEIPVERGPQPRLEAVAQVSFKGADWVLRLGPVPA